MENSSKRKQHRGSCYSFTSIFTGATLVSTVAATACLSIALLTNHWETVTFVRDQVERVANSSQHSLRWVSKRLARVDTSEDGVSKIVKGVSSSVYSQQKMNNSTGDLIFLITLYGGVNAICTDISDEERSKLLTDEFSPPVCLSYLTPEGLVFRNAWLVRMHNLAMSCAMVSLILLATCALVGAFGLMKRQLSAIMVTGVMFFLAALFGLFTLAFMYFKRVKPEGVHTSTVIDKGIPVEYLRAREFTMGWSALLGLGGVILCSISSIFWLLLARVLRYQSFTIT
ncbi:uncharacterized protein LOC111087338 [Limulus polyphemus]|uniref:Uncharacterized protein LOC111087338 n=1 Tax=Limulus polyphemus TaxID=6850 RepID=A0ABM1T0E1_LIMPO|nr:uncharacterized protein LOC111087338 [Limulus polyphemus]